jgi:hypothetical protein
LAEKVFKSVNEPDFPQIVADARRALYAIIDGDK